MPLQAIDFKSIAYAIPPPGQAEVYVRATALPARNSGVGTVS
jgi:hypothetical protein